MFNADKIFSRRDSFRNGEFETVFLPGTPVGVCVGGAGADTGFVDFEPVARAVVAGYAGCGGFGHVDEAGAGVFDESGEGK